MLSFHPCLVNKLTSILKSVPGNSAWSDGEGEDECESGSHEEDADAGRGGRVQVEGHRQQDAGKNENKLSTSPYVTI